MFIGEHDFAAFRTAGSREKTTVRRVLASQWTRAGNHLLYHIEATSFLRHMVRTMVAAMAEAGRGQLNVAAVDAPGLARSRRGAGAPGWALSCAVRCTDERHRALSLLWAAVGLCSGRPSRKGCSKIVTILTEKNAISTASALAKLSALVQSQPNPATRVQGGGDDPVAGSRPSCKKIWESPKSTPSSRFEELNALVVRELKGKEGKLRLAGLGIFRKRMSKARMGRNPATGEAIQIKAKTRLRFTAAKALKDSVLGAKK